MRYNGHLMRSNMTSIAFVQSNNRYTMKAVFGELLRHKEAKKFKLLKHAVENDMDPGIKDLEDHNFEKSKQILNRSQYRASGIVRNMLGKRLFAYFQKWKSETSHYSVTMNAKIRIKMTQMIKGKYAVYFYHWKSNSFNKKN